MDFLRQTAESLIHRESQLYALASEPEGPALYKETLEDDIHILEELKNDTRTLIVYEAPHHLLGTLKELQNALGDRRLTVCRELTKKFETAFQTTFSEAISYYEEQGVRGECVLVIEGRSREELVQEQQQSWEAISVEEHMERYLSTGMDRKSAMKQVAKDRGVGKREIYQALLEEE